MKFFASFILLISAPIFAHPTSYKGALGVMTWNQPDFSDNWITYSFRPDMAVAARYMRMEMEDGTSYAYLPQFDFLAQRWNAKEFQVNIYGYAGYGIMKMPTEQGNAWLGGIEADAESRSLFISGKAEGMKSRVSSYFTNYEFRLGAAPYEAEFNELAAWFMVQYQYHPTLAKKQSITPLGRFFYRNVLWEAGVSLDGDYMLNLMFHF